ncbi:MAG: ECF-type sigma factor [Planctomycetota bacterium]
MDDAKNEVTRLLIAASDGELAAAEQLMPMVYDHLRGMARGYMKRERSDHTLQSTALVHEAYLQLVDQTRVQWKNRAHFFAVASMAMRRALVRSAEKRGAQKRGGDRDRVPLEDHHLRSGTLDVDLIALDEALERLDEREPRLARVVEMRYFGGMTHAEIAEVQEVDERTVQRDWQLARAYLLRDLSADSDPEPSA